MTHPKRANQTPPQRKKKEKTTTTRLLHCVFDNQAVLLKCDHELGLNLANPQIYSDN